MNHSIYSPSFRIDDILKRSSFTTISPEDHQHSLSSLSIKNKIQYQHVDRKDCLSSLIRPSSHLWPYFYTRCNQTITSSRRKGGQIRFSVKQSLELEKRFEINQYLLPIERQQLVETLQLTDRQIKTWFQNRRAKHRRSTTKHDMNKSFFSTQQTDDDNEEHERSSSSN